MIPQAHASRVDSFRRVTGHVPTHSRASWTLTLPCELFHTISSHKQRNPVLSRSHEEDLARPRLRPVRPHSPAPHPDTALTITQIIPMSALRIFIGSSLAFVTHPQRPCAAHRSRLLNKKFFVATNASASCPLPWFVTSSSSSFSLVVYFLSFLPFCNFTPTRIALWLCSLLGRVLRASVVTKQS